MQRILLVTDNKDDVKQVTSMLAGRYELAVARDNDAAAKAVTKKRPALFLVDSGLAEEKGLSARQFAGQADAGAAPVIFITDRNRPEDVARTFGRGGQDHVSRPFCAEELCARLDLHLQLRQSVGDLRNCALTIERKNHQLRDLAEQIENSARIDLLTAIPNRWYMLERMKDEVARAFRHQRPFTLISVNIDNFKVINDKYGRDCSDFVLQNIADMLRASRRGEDVVARWEGDVFLIMLPETHIADGGRVAERIRAGIENAKITYLGKKIPVTVTVGVAEYERDIGIEGTVKKAEAAVAAGKRAKNCVVILPNK